MSDETCKNCKFSKAGGIMSSRKCHRWPPAVTGVGLNPSSSTIWPAVKDDDWCGEWAAKEK